MANQVNVGDKAPDFNLLDMEKRVRSLKEFLGQKVVLVFFVGAFTSTCTKEVCDFRDGMAQLVNLKAQIVGIDVKVPFSNKAFAEKNRLPFPVLSDYKREVSEAYGLGMPILTGSEDGTNVCCVGSGCYPIAKRSIFILDEHGFIRYKWVAENSIVEPCYEEIKRVLKEPTSEETIAKVPRTIITISRQLGSGGDEIALRVCKVLGYNCFDKSLMIRVANRLGISEEDIADFSEDNYRVKTFVDKILLRKKPVISNELENNSQIRKVFDEEKSLSVIQTVINSLACRGETVIVGRGGQAILKDKIGVLHVRIVAPEAVRIERIMKNGGLSRETALKLIRESDKAHAEYLKRFYNIDWEDPAIYDMVLNTGKMDLITAARVIASVGQSW